MTAMVFYPYLVAAHVTAVVFFVGGLFAHDRMMNAVARHPLHQQAATLALLFDVDRRITTPAMLLTWALGLSLAVWAGWFPSAWLIVKLIFVLALSALHGIQSGRLRRYVGNGTAAKIMPGAGLGIIVAMFAIAVLAIAKPI
jgi:protoporphyrinogen IX oxidase